MKPSGGGDPTTASRLRKTLTPRAIVFPNTQSRVSNSLSNFVFKRSTADTAKRVHGNNEPVQDDLHCLEQFAASRYLSHDRLLRFYEGCSAALQVPVAECMIPAAHAELTASRSGSGRSYFPRVLQTPPSVPKPTPPVGLIVQAPLWTRLLTTARRCKRPPTLG